MINEKYQSIWILFLGNALYMLSVGSIVYLSNRAKKFDQSPVTSAISGHVLSFTGAAISVILSVILYLAFTVSSNGEKLHKAPADMSVHPAFSMIFILILVAALGNTITGFFAALFTSFDTSKQKQRN
ncbi:MAG: hypothetical protein ABJA35_14370 [Parafilimonas sp.]